MKHMRRRKETDSSSLAFTFRQVIRISIIYLLLSLMCCLMILIRKYEVGYLAYGYLIWNLFLAWIPFVLSVCFVLFYKKLKPGLLKYAALLLLGGGWFFFYPNAPYMITDYIHLGTIQFYEMNAGIFSGYNQDPLVWFDLAMMSSFILIGVLLGFLSLYLLHVLVAERFGGFLAWGFVFAVLGISSFGIYLGRFIRWNTWDILSNPIGLLHSMIESVQGDAPIFTLIFGVFLSLIYLALFQLMRKNQKP